MSISIRTSNRGYFNLMYQVIVKKLLFIHYLQYFYIFKVHRFNKTSELLIINEKYSINKICIYFERN